MKKKLFFMCRCNDACVFLLSFKFFSVSKENKNFSQRTFHYSSIQFNILVIFLCRGCCCFYCSFIIIFSKFIVEYLTMPIFAPGLFLKCLIHDFLRDEFLSFETNFIWCFIQLEATLLKFRESKGLVCTF
jgi:hypothetical protein